MFIGVESILCSWSWPSRRQWRGQWPWCLLFFIFGTVELYHDDFEVAGLVSCCAFLVVIVCRVAASVLASTSGGPFPRSGGVSWLLTLVRIRCLHNK